METEPLKGFGTSLHRSILTDDGRFVAKITSEQHLSLLNLQTDGRLVEVANTSLPKPLQQIIGRLSTFRSAPVKNAISTPSDDTETEALMPYLLFSDGLRLIVVNSNKWATGLNESASTNGTNPTSVVADYQLGDQYGKLSYATFVLDSAHVLALFEMGASASILSLTKPYKDEIPNVKFNSDRGIGVSPDGRSVAMLLRTKGQDQVTVLCLKDENIQVEATFNTNTNDAQGVAWSPDGDPVLAVRDSAAYGVRIAFFSALGHPLKQLEVSDFGGPHGISGVGVVKFEWATAETGTMMALADGEKRVLVRRQHNRTMSIQQLGLLVHQNVIDGSKATVWQQTGDSEFPFSLQKGAFDAVTDHNGGGAMNMLEFNCSRDFIATVVADNPKAVWLWQTDHPEPHTIILFQENVQQILWHPKRPEILLIVTGQKSPVVYVWYSETKAPSPCGIPMEDMGSTKYQGHWLSRSIQGRHSFMLTTTKALELGMLEVDGGSVLFKSLLRNTLASSKVVDEDDSTQEISTPSKPSKIAASNGNLHIMQGHPAPHVDAADFSRW